MPVSNFVSFICREFNVQGKVEIKGFESKWFWTLFNQLVAYA